MAPVSLPERIDQVDASWVHDALVAGSRGTDGAVPDINAVQVDALPPGESFLGSLARVTVDYADRDRSPATAALPRRFLLKLPTADAGGREVASLLGTYMRESRFYAELARDVGVNVPVCYFNGADLEANRFALLLEDLHPATKGDQVAGASPGETDRVVGALALLHGRWWGRPRGPFPEWVPGIDRSEVHLLADAIVASQPAFAGRWADHVPPITLGWLERAATQVNDILSVIGQHPLTLGHADVRLDNLMFGLDGTTWLLDWQTAMRTHGMTDLTFFLATNLTVGERRRRERELIDLYRAGLARQGADLSQDDAWQLHRTSVLWWMAMLSNNLATIDPPDDRGRALFRAIIERMFTAAEDLEVGKLLA